MGTSIPENEEARLAVLRAYQILDTPPEKAFDDLVQLASHICGAPIALMSLVDHNRLWIKSRVGLDANETPRETAFCSHTILGEDLMIVADTHNDSRFAGNPLVTSSPHIRFYAGAPLRARSGHNLGALCVVDAKPRELDSHQRQALAVLSAQITVQLEMRAAFRALAANESSSRAQAEAIERLQAQKNDLTTHIVHDLKSPLMAVLGNASVLAESTLDDVQECAQEIEAAARSMNRMLLDLLDVSAADDGEFHVRPTTACVRELLAEVCAAGMARVRVLHCGVQIRVDAPELKWKLDRDIVRRVLENLVDNAIKYGAGEIVLKASSEGGALELQCIDDGPGIPSSQREIIFERYARLTEDKEGIRSGSHGLGLRFCRLAADAHNGKIWVDAAPVKGSVFHLSIP